VSDTKRTVVKIGGMHCAGCVNSIQRHVSNLQGVSKIEVNLANERAMEYDPAQVKMGAIEKGDRGDRLPRCL
jgi:Cu+-exporting ATPase